MNLEKLISCAEKEEEGCRAVLDRYVPVEETLRSEELGEYISYGIQVLRGEVEVAFVSDVTTDREEIRRLTALCTEHGLALEHLEDVIEDFLGEDG